MLFLYHDLQRNVFVRSKTDAREIKLPVWYAIDEVDVTYYALQPTGDPTTPYTVNTITALLVSLVYEIPIPSVSLGTVIATLPLANTDAFVPTQSGGSPDGGMAGTLTLGSAGSIPDSLGYAIAILSADVTTAEGTKHVENRGTLKNPSFPITLPEGAGYPDAADTTLAVENSIAQLPAGQIEGLPLEIRANSYGWTGPTNAPYNARRSFDRVADRMRAPVRLNYSVPGALAMDVCTFAYGSYTAGTTDGTQAGTWTPGALRGALIVDAIRNDAGRDGTTATGGSSAKARTGFVNALDALIRLLRSSAKIEDTDASFVYSAGWGTSTGALYSGGSMHYTTTPGSTCTVTMPAGTDFDLIVHAVDSAGPSGAGATFTYSVDGGPPVAGTTNDQVRYSLSNPQSNYLCQMAIPLRGLGSAAHTVVLTSTSGGVLVVDCLLVASPTPPTIVLPTTPHLSAQGYAFYVSTYGAPGASAAVDDIYNGLLATVVARFPADGSIAVWDRMAGGFDPNAMFVVGDGVHFNDRGSAFDADGIVKTLNGLPYRIGQNASGQTPYPVPNVAGGTTVNIGANARFVAIANGCKLQLSTDGATWQDGPSYVAS